MKMTDMEVFLIETPPPRTGGEVWYTIRILTDEGIYGLGEAMPHYTFHNMPETFRSYITDVFRMWFKGKDPFKREMLLKTAYAGLCGQRPDIIGMSMLSAIENGDVGYLR